MPNPLAENDRTPEGSPEKTLADFGWSTEPTEGGGVRMRRTALWRGAMIGCSFTLLLPFALVGLWLAFLGPGFREGPKETGVWRVLSLLIPLGIVGGLGLYCAAIVWQILRLALFREEWEARRNMLVLRRGLIGFLCSDELTGGQLLLEPHYEQDDSGRQWRVAVICNGEKRHLLREPESRIGRQSTRDSQAETTAIAGLIAAHTGWNVSTTDVAVEGQTRPPSDSSDDELLAALRSRGFVAEVDARLRLTIRPPRVARCLVGLVLAAFALGWLWFMGGIAHSFMNDPQARQRPLLQIPF